ncbi:MAG: DUF4129 domain-containing protein [Oscillospiraceae bacterium]|nr:DUF4129 domain-containing protein [Oscillospiraceae bacterium]
MSHYCKSRAADWVLCTCITVGMAYAIFAGFVLEDDLSNTPLLTFVAGFVLEAVLLAFAYRRRTVIIGIAVGVVALIAAVVYIQANHPMTDETANSLFLAVLILIVTGLLVFLLSRTRPGILALFLMGTIIQAGSHFLQFPAPAWAFVLFLLAVFILFFYRCYTVSIRRAALGKIDLGGYTRQSAVICLIALLLSGGAYFGIVRPLNPPTQELRLITLMKSMDILEVLGVSSVRTVLDEEQTSSENPEDEEQGNNPGEEEDEDAMNAPEESSEPSDNAEPESDTDQTEAYSATAYLFRTRTLLWLLLLIPLGIAAAVALRIWFRRRWRAQVRGLSREDGAVNYYRFFLRRLKRAGLGKPPTHTLRQYAETNATALEPFAAGQATFPALTEIYQAVLYGDKVVTVAEFQLFEQFYDGFYANLRREMGLPKYLLHWFFL